MTLQLWFLFGKRVSLPVLRPATIAIPIFHFIFLPSRTVHFLKASSSLLWTRGISFPPHLK